MPISASGASRRDFLRLSSALGAAGGLAASLAACGGFATDPTATPPAGGAPIVVAKPDGVITAGISYQLGADGFDPMKSTSALAIAANWHTLEGLTELHPNTRTVYAALAAELPAQVDELTYEVRLRSGASFSNGTAVTVEDVVFSFERVLDPANRSHCLQFLTFIEAITAKDESTVTITTKFPFSLVAERLSVVKIVPQAIVEADAGSYGMFPLGSGPYVMTDNGRESQTVLFERNDNYNGPRPALAQSMAWQILPDDTARTNALTSGTVQVIDTVPVASLDALEAPITVVTEQGFSLVFAMFNQSTLSDLGARQAVMYALDYSRICEEGMAMLAAPATCFVHEDHPAYRRASTVYSYDPAKARSLIAEAGITHLNVLFADHGFFSGARPIIRQNLEALGVTVSYEEMRSAEVYDTIDAGQYAWDVVVAPGDPSVFGNDADLLLRWWYGNEVWTDTRMHWKDTESYTAVHAALDEAVELSGDEQVAKWQEVFDLVAESIPLYPLFHREIQTAYDPETLSGFKPIAMPGLSFVDVGSAQS